jgi:ribosomal protein S18 acetylase RimI-like enzyme
MIISNLNFKTMDLKQHADVCVKFRKDAFVVSFGSDEHFRGSDGKGADRYLEDNHRRIEADPESCVHVWQDNRIIGQIELEMWFKDPAVGYIDLFYLIPECRGKGYGDALEQYAESYFQKRNVKQIRLSVSPTNIRAVKFYKKHGWKDCGPREGFPLVHYMEKNI